MWEWLSWDGLGHVADALSLVTAFVSGYAALKVRKIGARLAFNVRSDDVLARVDEHARWINECLTVGGYDRNQLINRLAQCRAEIRSAHGGIDGEALLAAKRFDKLYLKYEKVSRAQSMSDDVAKQHFWGMLNEMAAFAIHARSLIGDRRVGSEM